MPAALSYGSRRGDRSRATSTRHCCARGRDKTVPGDRRELRGWTLPPERNRGRTSRMTPLKGSAERGGGRRDRLGWNPPSARQRVRQLHRCLLDVPRNKRNRGSCWTGLPLCRCQASLPLKRTPPLSAWSSAELFITYSDAAVKTFFLKIHSPLCEQTSTAENKRVLSPGKAAS